MRVVEVLADKGGVRVIRCVGDFDLGVLAPLTAACEAAAADPGVAKVVLDVSAVGFADSAFLNRLLWLRRQQPTVLAGPLPSRLLRLLQLTGALSVFTIADGVEAARTI
ncbi:STAS domain-containing protein [Streptomyces sp. enrichment culture]|uniref:STAS domain-containing protein n=1 Tax=Streptomyces sp. enrichment culture TaxID=1795815 RepID=UPI003F574FC9